ncbi:substrate-binding domain-containing protein [Streptomyces sp. UP1A-1]|nr:substrate-binding domain-containing protein [Streptomyces sp. UP1A-1]
MEIATLPGNPERISSLEDLTASGLKVVLCDKSVPCGAAAQKALAAARSRPHPGLLRAGRQGRPDEGRAEGGRRRPRLPDRRQGGRSGKVAGVDFPEAAEAVNDYPITVLEDAPNPGAAKAFVALVKSAKGQRVLTDAGFGTP